MNRKEFLAKSSLLGLIPFIPFYKTLNFSTMNGNPFLASPNLSNSYWYIGHLMSVLVSSKDTNGAFSLIHGYEIQGLEPPPHTHTKEDESFYLLSGEIEYTVGNQIIAAKEGDWAFLPRNIQHSFKVLTEKAEVLMHLSPGGFEDYFIEMSEPAKEMVIPTKPQGPPNVQKIIEVASKYGIIFPKR
jgi:quercetin dioxygenase-like cupin family protein